MLSKIKIFFSIIIAFFTVGCATPRIPIPVVSYEANIVKSNLTVAIVVDDLFLQQAYKTSQLFTTWIYPLGDVLPLMIEKSLRNRFAVADIVPDYEASDYKVIIRPALDKFYAQVPATTFSSTNTDIKITYGVTYSGSEFSVTGRGTNEEITEDDKALFASYKRKLDYKFQAAGDAGIAILHCLEDLNVQLAKELKARTSAGVAQ
ncbi:hypothetical protein IB286_15200 [Spongiibacter sp. KMU-158]|uniref:ABC-type transport auxiliary lipoprotein component domain-containing protein n=1 Tax=Spongiibacter pelagi TaxID=2760804 RepID=A0A927C2Y0_9GAMM|nr:hypothetical protein [Spongiibacter pelagi]MBD2860340.1 hypothetical protein [Spongiibacter pelagi]